MSQKKYSQTETRIDFTSSTRIVNIFVINILIFFVVFIISLSLKHTLTHTHTHTHTHKHTHLGPLPLCAAGCQDPTHCCDQRHWRRALCPVQWPASWRGMKMDERQRNAEDITSRDVARSLSPSEREERRREEESTSLHSARKLDCGKLKKTRTWKNDEREWKSWRENERMKLRNII